MSKEEPTKLREIGDYIVQRKVMLLINHISRSTRGIDELVKISAKIDHVNEFTILLFLLVNLKVLKKAIYVFVVCSNKILISSIHTYKDTNALKKSYIHFLPREEKR